jgi:hypothetical protein
MLPPATPNGRLISAWAPRRLLTAGSPDRGMPKGPVRPIILLSGDSTGTARRRALGIRSPSIL